MSSSPDGLDGLAASIAGRYVIGREIGRGGMAIVYLAEDVKHHRRVALKVLRPELAAAVGGLRFQREIEIAATLAHPHILPLFDSGDADGTLFFVMPFVDGESLRQRLAREHQLPLEDALRIAREVADALAYAHDHGIIHRDIKPENILLEAGHALVSDFGIARAVGPASADTLTETGLAVGTPAYMSPEQALGDEELDARSDIYALGCVLYEMLSGETPFTGSTPQSIVAKKLHQPVPRVSVLRTSVPAALESALVRALAKVPADRFPSAAAFRDALAESALTVRPPWKRVTDGWRIRMLGLIATGVVVALGAAVLLRTRAASPGPIAVAQLTARPGVEDYPSLSPDGKWLLFSGEGDGHRDIFLQSVGGQLPIDLTPDSPDDDFEPALSPDGERIAFRSSRDGGGIFVMGRTGEAAQRVSRCGFNPSWSPDGLQLAVATEDVGVTPLNWSGRSEIWIATVGTGELRRLSEGDGVQPAWSPNGRRIAYTARIGDASQMDIWTIPVNGGPPTLVTHDAATDWSPTWSPDGRLLYFVSDRGGSMNIWRLRIDEESGEPRGAPEAITTPAPFVAHLAISADGRRIAYSSVLETQNIQMITLDSATGSVIGEPT